MSSSSTSSISSCSPPIMFRHAMVTHLKTKTFTANNSHESVRVMATLTAVQDLSEEDRTLVPTLTRHYSASIVPSASASSSNNSSNNSSNGSSSNGNVPKNDDTNNTSSTEALDASTTTTSNNNSSNATTLRVITLDDGTDTINVWCEQQLLDGPSIGSGGGGGYRRRPDLEQQHPPQSQPQQQQEPLELGMTLDCILKLRQSASIKRWIVQCIIVVDDPAVDEPLRWLQLGHQERYWESQQQQQQQRSSTSYNDNPRLCHEFGFPTCQRDTLSEVYRLICVQAQIAASNSTTITAGSSTARTNNHKFKRKNDKNGGEDDNDEDAKYRARRRSRGFGTSKSVVMGTSAAPPPPTTTTTATTTTSSTASSMPLPPPLLPPPPPPPPPEGVLLEDLALVMQINQRRMQELVQELQLQGQVYQNERGEFLPL